MYLSSFFVSHSILSALAPVANKSIYFLYVVYKGKKIECINDILSFISYLFGKRYKNFINIFPFVCVVRSFFFYFLSSFVSPTVV